MDDKFFADIVRMVLPEEFLISFDISNVKAGKKEIKITLTEKKELIPEKLLNIVSWDTSKVVLDWYCRSIELMDFPMRERASFIILKRRRWKLDTETWADNLNKDKTFSNEYFFNFDWMKTTKKFGLFLKELTRDELNELLNSYPAYGDPLKETI